MSKFDAHLDPRAASLLADVENLGFGLVVTHSNESGQRLVVLAKAAGQRHGYLIVSGPHVIAAAIPPERNLTPNTERNRRAHWLHVGRATGEIDQLGEIN